LDRERKRIEDAIHDAVESLQEGLALYDADDRLILVNDVYRQINPTAQEYIKRGISFEELLRINVKNGLHVEAAGLEEEYIQERLEQHRNPGGPFTRQYSSGKWYIIKESRTPKGNTAITFTDITERKKVEEALNESEDLLNSIFENVPVGLLIKDANHVVERPNSTYLDWYGLDLDAMVGRRSDQIEDFQSSDEAKFMNAQELDVLTTGQTQSRQVERPFFDGQIHTLNITKFPVYDQQGNITKVGSVSVDVTESRLAEERLRNSEAQLVNALEAISEGFVLYGPDGRLIICNSQFKDFYNYSDDEAAPGVHSSDLGRLDIERGNVVVDNDQVEVYLTRRDDLKAGPPESLVVELRDGRKVMLHDRKTANGGIVSIQTDITELKNSEDALRRSEAKHKEFSADVAHELRTPLAVLRAQLDNLRNEKIKQALIPDVDALTHLVERILTMSQLDSVDVRSGKRADLCEVCSVVAASLGPIAVKVGRSIEVTGAKGPLTVKGDADALVQAVQNLVENAIRYANPDSTITIDVSDDPAIKISNLGVTIPPEKREILFNRFEQADRRSGGAGLGLAIVKRVVESHCGSVDITDVPGGGAAFTIRLPKSLLDHTETQ